jgi:hypothetical protein
VMEAVAQGVLDAAYEDYLEGDRYIDLVRRYGVSKIRLLRYFRTRGLRGGRGIVHRARDEPGGIGWDQSPTVEPVTANDRYGWYIMYLKEGG